MRIFHFCQCVFTEQLRSSWTVTQFRSDYVMARQVRTDVQARHSLLSGDLPALAKGGSWYVMVESFGFWGRKFCIKNVEILSVGKIAEFAKFAGGKRRKSPDRCLFNRAKRVIV